MKISPSYEFLTSGSWTTSMRVSILGGVYDPARINLKSPFRARAKITSQNLRSDLVQVWLIRESKTTGIASYFADFASEVSAKDGLKLRCKNVKLFLREP
jgi:hypothetical protein